MHPDIQGLCVITVKSWRAAPNRVEVVCDEGVKQRQSAKMVTIGKFFCYRLHDFFLLLTNLGGRHTWHPNTFTWIINVNLSISKSVICISTSIDLAVHDTTCKTTFKPGSLMRCFGKDYSNNSSASNTNIH